MEHGAPISPSGFFFSFFRFVDTTTTDDGGPNETCVEFPALASPPHNPKFAEGVGRISFRSGEPAWLRTRAVLLSYPRK